MQCVYGCAVDMTKNAILDRCVYIVIVLASIPTVHVSLARKAFYLSSMICIEQSTVFSIHVFH